MKWSNLAGPRKSKAALSLLRELQKEQRMHVGLHGVIGGAERSTTYWSPFGGPDNAAAAAECQALGERFRWTITNENLTEIELAAKDAIARAVAGRPISDQRVAPEKDAERAAVCAERDRAQRENRAVADAAWAAVMAKKPAWASALIVAELKKDESDLMSDHHWSSTERVIAIGWRRGVREDFKQLRAAAALFPETAHLGPSAPESVEHRENYSMGAGNYLAAGYRHSTGWQVCSRSGASSSYVIEDRLPATIGPTPPSPSTPTQGVMVRPSSIGRAGVVEIVFESKPNKDVRSELKASGFRWAGSNGCWYGPEDRLPSRYRAEAVGAESHQ